MLGGDAARDDQLAARKRSPRGAHEVKRLCFRCAIGEQIDTPASRSACQRAMVSHQRARSFQPCWMSNRFTGKRKVAGEISEDAPGLIEIGAAQYAIDAKRAPGLQRLR